MPMRAPSLSTPSTEDWGQSVFQWGAELGPALAPSVFVLPHTSSSEGDTVRSF